MELSRKTDYALRTMIELSAGDGDTTSATELARRTQVPYTFLTKILAELSAHRLVSITRGRTGGARLAVDPARTTALQIIETIGGPITLNRCVVEADSCPRQTYCSVHEMCSTARKGLRKSLSVDLKTLAAAQKRKRGEPSAENNCKIG